MPVVGRGPEALRLEPVRLLGNISVSMLCGVALVAWFF